MIKKPIPYELCHKIIDDIDHKLCNTCEQWLPCDIDFYKNKLNKMDGYNAYCKKCTKLKYDIWRRENKEARSLQQKRYQNKPSSRKKEREFKKSPKSRQLYKEWVKSNPDKIKSYNEFRRMHKAHEITDMEWESCLTYFKHSCAYCGIHQEDARMQQGHGLHKEHVDPYGTHDISNNIPACRSCNSSKRVKTLEEWYNKEHPKYTELRYERIKIWIAEEYLKYKE